MNFKGSQKEEVSSLIDRRGFKVVDKSKKQGYKIFRTHTVEEWKNGGTPTQFSKCRLVVKAYDNRKMDLWRIEKQFEDHRNYFFVSIEHHATELFTGV